MQLNLASSSGTVKDKTKEPSPFV